MKINSRFHSNNATRNNSFLFLEGMDDPVQWGNSGQQKPSDEVTLVLSLLNQISSEQQMDPNPVGVSSNISSPRQHRIFTRSDQLDQNGQQAAQEPLTQPVVPSSRGTPSYTSVDMVRRLQQNFVDELNQTEAELLRCNPTVNVQILKSKISNIRRQQVLAAELQQLMAENQVLNSRLFKASQPGRAITVQTIQLLDSSKRQPSNADLPEPIIVPTNFQFPAAIQQMVAALPQQVPKIIKSEALFTKEPMKEKNSANQPQIKIPGSDVIIRSKPAQATERWSEEEHEKFLDAVEKYGRKRQTQISEYLGNRSVKQVISHSQKFFGKLEKAFNQRLQLSKVDVDRILSEVIRPTFITHNVQKSRDMQEHDRKTVYEICCKVGSVLEVCQRPRIVAEWLYEYMCENPDKMEAIACVV